jgi:hypothetical protein
MQRLLLGLKLHDLVPKGGHVGFNAVDRLALFEDLGRDRLLALAAATTASNTAIGSKRRREWTDHDETPPSVDSERRGTSASNKIARLGGTHRT